LTIRHFQSGPHQGHQAINKGKEAKSSVSGWPYVRVKANLEVYVSFQEEKQKIDDAISAFIRAKGNGGDIFDAKNQVGHSDIRTTINIYGHIFEEDSLDLAQKLDIALKNVH
jgi:hypothetical protein